MSSAAAKKYFSGGLTRDDYYVSEVELVGVWGGKAAAKLGLNGEVSKAAFGRLCENRRPLTGEPLTLRTRAERRVGYDFNFHCPKSVSLLYSLTGDARLLDAFRVAVRETMERMEAEMKARVRTGGAEHDRQTGNLVWAEFVHTTARPVGGIPDPHLHAHCFVFNATWDEVQGVWKAGQFGDLKRDAAYFEAAFHCRLAELVGELGYGVQQKGRFWEVDGVPTGVIEKFSTRTTEIERYAQRKGIKSAAEKDKLGAKTRDRKSSARPYSEVLASWRERLGVLEWAALASARVHGHAKLSKDHAREAVREAVEKLLERDSVVLERSVAEQALRFGVGKATVVDVEKALAETPLLRREVDGRVFVTTKEVLAEERAMLAFARDGVGRCDPFCRPGRAKLSPKLGTDQKAMAEHVLESRDRVTLVRGVAGTGKTVAMLAVVEALEGSGVRVHAFAPTTDARDVLRKDGTPKAETVQKLLQDEELQKTTRGGVIWVDEAGLMGTRTTRQVFDVAEKQGARVLLSGDFRQHGSVERGDALRLLETHAGLRSAMLTDIRRQRGKLRDAVTALSEGEAAKGFAILEELGSIREVKSREERLKAVVNEFVDAVKEKKQAVVISPTHAEGDDVTRAIRNKLREDGKLGTGRVVVRLKNLHLTEADKSRRESYQRGQVVVFNRRLTFFEKLASMRVVTGRFEASVPYKVMGTNVAGRVVLRHGSSLATLPLDKPKLFDVFKEEKIELAKGDLIRVTRNTIAKNERFGLSRLMTTKEKLFVYGKPERWPDLRKRVSNGFVGRFEGFAVGGGLKLSNGCVLESGFGHIDYGYCLTSHAAQGRTVDVAIVSQSEESKAASSLEQFYVSASRAREKVVVFTDNREELRKWVSESGERKSATEVFEAEREQGREHVREREAERER